MAYGFNPFAVVRVHGGDASTLLHAFRTFEEAMLYARSKARDGSQIDVLDCSNPDSCVPLAVAVGRTDEYLSTPGMSYLDNPARRKSFGPGNITKRPKEPPAGTYSIFGFTEHPAFTLVAVDDAGQKHFIGTYVTFGQAIYHGRNMAQEAAQHGEVIAVLGCLEGRCGVPLVSGVGTEREWYLPRSRAYVSNPAQVRPKYLPRKIPGTYPIFGFTDHPTFTVAFIDPEGGKDYVGKFATFGQAMMQGRGMAREAEKRGDAVVVLGCLGGQCNTPLVINVGTEREHYLPWGQEYVSNPVKRPKRAKTREVVRVGHFIFEVPADSGSRDLVDVVTRGRKIALKYAGEWFDNTQGISFLDHPLPPFEAQLYESLPIQVHPFQDRRPY